MVMDDVIFGGGGVEFTIFLMSYHNVLLYVVVDLSIGTKKRHFQTYDFGSNNGPKIPLLWLTLLVNVHCGFRNGLVKAYLDYIKT
jgi:hypothetical protein